MTVGVYGLEDPLIGCVMYVGQSRDIEARFAGHVGQRRGGMWLSIWLRRLHERGQKPVLRVLYAFPEGFVFSDDLDAKEVQVLAEYRAKGEALLNEANGGRHWGRLHRGRPREALAREQMLQNMIG